MENKYEWVKQGVAERWITKDQAYDLIRALLSKPHSKKERMGRGIRAKQDKELDRIISAQEDEDDSSDVLEEIDPESYRVAFLIRADQALKFAVDCEKLSGNLVASDEFVDWVNRVVNAWKNTLIEMEKRKK